jgi:hypothetical protein
MCPLSRRWSALRQGQRKQKLPEREGRAAHKNDQEEKGEIDTSASSLLS